MDNDFFWGCVATATVIISIVAGSTIGYVATQNAHTQFAQACISAHKSVVGEEVNGYTVTECK